MFKDEFDFSTSEDDPIDLLKHALRWGLKDDGIVASLKACVRRNDWEACSWLALCYKVGFGVPRDDFVCDALLTLSDAKGSMAREDVVKFLLELGESQNRSTCCANVEDYSVVDIETTGLSFVDDDITELAAIRIRGGKVVDHFQELVRTDKTIPEVVVQKTHITNDMVSNARPIGDVLPSFLDFVGNDVLVGYNIDRFDLEFISHKAKEELNVLIHPRTIDVWQLAKQRLTGIGSYSLDHLRQIFEIDAQGAHRALKDCQDTNEVYRILRSMPEGSSSESRRVDSLNRRQVVEANPNDKAVLKRCAQLLELIPAEFSPVMKAEIPLHYKERWAYVAEHPFKTFASSILSITGSSELVPRPVAEEIVTRLGATLKASTTTRDCDFCVVLGDEGVCKREAAERWIAKGSPLRIIGPEEFLEMMHASIAECREKLGKQ